MSASRRHRALLALPLILIGLALGLYLLVGYGTRLGAMLHHPAVTPHASSAPARLHYRRAPSSPVGAVLTVIGLAAAATLALTAFGSALTVRRRFVNRRRRRYQRYELHLSMHDEAKPKDLDDMIEAIANALRPPLPRRWREGQPFIAIELIYRQAQAGMEWTLCLLCERRIAATLEGIIGQAYPDTWLGRRFAEDAAGGLELEVPGCVLRFRKRRPYFYPLSRPVERTASRERKPSSPLEGIARAQVAAGTPSVVRFQLMPVIDGFEQRARERLRRRERQAAGHRHHGLTLSERAEFASAVEVQDRAIFHLELQVGANDWETANSIAASVMARRGENHLHRRYMRVRQGMYRRRFPTAYPPWLPPLSRRDVVSGGEIAYLFELPTARMKGVPVRRLTRPRIPAPPEMPRTRRHEIPTCKTDAPLAEAGVGAPDYDYGTLFDGRGITG